MGRSPPAFLSPVQTALVALMLLVLPACQQADDGFDVPAVSVRTADDRRESLEALKAAWYSRPAQSSPQNERSERFFLNRLGSFVQRTRGQEIYGTACGLWNTCVRDHAARYRDSAAGSGQ